MNDYSTWSGRTVYDSEGNKVGELRDIYVDEKSGKPTWATVKTGFFGTKENFFPLGLAEQRGEDIVVQATSDQIKEAPKVDVDEVLSPEEEHMLYDYYQQVWDDTTPDPLAGTAAGADNTREYDETESGGPEGAVGHDTSGPTTDNAMTRSEEQLEVGTRQQEAGRVRLKKYIVTEHVTQTVPVQREEVRLEREAITDENRDQALDGPAISEEEHEVVLNQEVPVVGTKTVPVERVRLNKQTIQDEQQVEGDVRKEKIDVEGDDSLDVK